VAGLPWNQWPDEPGMGGRITVECPAGWAWNTQGEWDKIYFMAKTILMASKMRREA
jgi:hypothetical protein